jgi:hypothetical protein
MRFYETITRLDQGAESLRHGHYGVIEAQGGRLERIVLRPYPKLASVPQAVLLGGWCHGHLHGDRCLLYYNQPRRFPNFLVLKYIQSSQEGSLASLNRVLETLDEIARIKRSDALLCDVSNWRISTAIMTRGGWQPHCPSIWHRHFIKRFYGAYNPSVGLVDLSRELAAV